MSKNNYNLYGLHAVKAAWINPNRKIDKLFLTEDSFQEMRPVFEEADEADIKRPHPTRTSADQITRALPPGAVHQGVMLEAKPLDWPNLKDFLNTQSPKTFVMLDQVTDPHNIGAILRSCAAFKTDGVIFQSKHTPAMSGLIAKIASGAVEHIPVFYETNLSRALNKLKDRDFFCYGLDERGKNILGQMDIADKAVFVMGAEGHGLRRLVGETCDQLVRLPTNELFPTLNVSNAAAVTLFARNLPA